MRYNKIIKAMSMILGMYMIFLIILCVKHIWQ